LTDGGFALIPMLSEGLRGIRVEKPR